MAEKNKNNKAIIKNFVKKAKTGMFAISDVTKKDGTSMAVDKATKRAKEMLDKEK